MKRIRVIIYKIFKPKIIDECIQSAYEDFQFLLETVFTNLYDVDLALTFEEFEAVFERYDWKDFIDCLEYLENSDLTTIDIVWNDELMDALISQMNNTISSKWDNSNFIEFID